MKKSLVALTVLALLATATALPALAFPPGHQGPRHGGSCHGPGLLNPRALPMMSEVLDLTDDQRSRIEGIFEEFRPAAPDEAFRAEMQALHAELKTLWTAEAPDRDAILAKLAEIDARQDVKRAERRERHVDMQLAVSAVLTPEQRAKLADLREQMKPDGPRGKGRRGGRGPCAQGSGLE